MINKIRQVFIDKYQKEPVLVSAPGRVNLIGEHTDYNQGFVLPGAIDKKMYIAISPNGTDTINVYANEFKEEHSFRADTISQSTGWRNYILGVTFYIQEQTNRLLPGVDVVIDGDVPVGGGMSSSAALCSGYGFALNEIFSLGLTRLDLVYIGQKTEHHFVGAMVGIMDQFASLHGKAGHLIKLDCRSKEYEYIPFHFPEYKIVMINTMVRHSLGSSEYNVRRQQCEEGVSILQKHYPQIQSLRDLNLDQLQKHRSELPELVFRRCKYVIEEIQRLLKGCEILENGDIKSFGKLMYRTHEGLSSEYEVSCEELDFLVREAKQFDSIAGSRMMGGGFGGCTINLVESGSVDAIAHTIGENYQNRFGQIPEIYITQIEDGVRLEDLAAHQTDGGKIRH